MRAQFIKLSRVIIFSVVTTLFSAAWSDSGLAATIVGNGDDGADLEGSAPLTSGPIFDARQHAVKKLTDLGAQGVPGLGKLIPEVSRSPLFMSKRDVPADDAIGGSRYHSDMRGLLFASTFTEPNAPTVFYPVATTLNDDQLVALHIHEALHRALPHDVAADETVVSQITMAIVSPESSYDRVKAVVLKTIPEVETSRMGFSPAEGNISTETYPIPEDAKVKRPSTFGLSYRSYNNPQNAGDATISPLTSMQTLQSFLYPFGNDKNPIGIGIELSYLNFADGISEMGPLNLSGRMRLWSSRGFDIGAWAQASLNTLSAEDLKNSPYGRDVYSVGLSMQKDLRHFYLENLIGITSAGSSAQQLANVAYTYNYGSVVNATVRAGAKIGWFHVGGFGELFLADYYRVNGGAFSFDTGRYQITSGGPELTFEGSGWAVGLYGRFILNTSQGATFDYLGNIMGQGTGQGSVGATISIKL